MIELTERDKPISNSGLVLLDFWAPWCGPCRMLGSVLDELAGELVDVTILKINVDEAQETASEYGIQTLPTLILLKDQQKIGTKTGFVSKTSILRWLEETRES